MEQEGTVNLVSKEGDVREVPVKVAKMSELVATTLEGDEDDDEMDLSKDVPLPNVSTAVLDKVIAFCTHYQQQQMTPIQTPLKSGKMEELVQKWYADFVNVKKNMLFDLVAAANFMDIKPLLDLTCLAVAILIKGKSADEVREMFNISPEPTEEEKAEMAARDAAAAAASSEARESG